jgi:hypothetical protein
VTLPKRLVMTHLRKSVSRSEHCISPDSQKVLSGIGSVRDRTVAHKPPVRAGQRINLPLTLYTARNRHYATGATYENNP